MHHAPGLLQGVLAIALASAGAVDCAGPSEMPPCDAADATTLCPASGRAHVEVTGFETYSFDAPLYADGSPRPMVSTSLGVAQLTFRDPAKLPGEYLSLFGMRLTGGAQQTGANLVIHGSGYTTSDGCTVTLTAFDARRVAGSFECRGMFPLELDATSSRLVDATGTFDAGP